MGLFLTLGKKGLHPKIGEPTLVKTEIIYPKNVGALVAMNFT